MHPASSRLILSTILAYVIHCIDGCGRTPARTKPATTTPSPGGGRPTTTSSVRPSGRSAPQLECTPAEEKKAACLNRGQCFALDLVGSRSAHCHCEKGWTGARCHRVDEDYFVLQAEHVIAGSVAAGVALVVIVATIVVVCLVLKKRKERKDRGQGGLVLSTNGCPAGRALMSEKDKENNEFEELQKCTDV
ncbi:pro-neuregulin-3, membrane-bound isoform-like isoform X2 [Elysia marginata]|uniref:Pro-neuregulin-3, membrane-bound isoform-like isoform X2 n=1 Tax=Elysia marginata TaxID=1093978 RepID=A0AAV4EYD6_9GAST|nr:pro-neuregulin-3, membrane-bound isoform-like isoform X2 [Elysia marginata]